MSQVHATSCCFLAAACAYSVSVFIYCAHLRAALCQWLVKSSKLCRYSMGRGSDSSSNSTLMFCRLTGPGSTSRMPVCVCVCIITGGEGVRHRDASTSCVAAGTAALGGGRREKQHSLTSRFCSCCLSSCVRLGTITRFGVSIAFTACSSGNNNSSGAASDAGAALRLRVGWSMMLCLFCFNDAMMMKGE